MLFIYFGRRSPACRASLLHAIDFRAFIACFSIPSPPGLDRDLLVVEHVALKRRLAPKRALAHFAWEGASPGPFGLWSTLLAFSCLLLDGCSLGGCSLGLGCLAALVGRLTNKRLTTVLGVDKVG